MERSQKSMDATAIVRNSVNKKNSFRNAPGFERNNCVEKIVRHSERKRTKSSRGRSRGRSKGRTKSKSRMKKHKKNDRVHAVDTKSDSKVTIFTIIFYFIFEFDFKIFKTTKLTHKNEIDNNHCRCSFKIRLKAWSL